MSATSTGLSAVAESRAGGEILIALEAADRASATNSAAAIRARLSERFSGCNATVLVTAAGTDPALVDPTDAPDVPALAGAAIAGQPSVLRTVLEEADRRGARAAALLSAGAHDESLDWLGHLFHPILEADFDFVSPSYRRNRFDGMLTTAIVYPLVR